MITLTRHEMYELVWQQPITKIAEKYVISDVGFRKACLRMNIPVPNAGYWSKIYAGQKMKPPELPAKFKGKDYLGLELRDAGQAVKTPSKLNKAAKSLSAQQLPFRVPERLTRPHPMIVAAKASLAKLRDRLHPGMEVTAKGELDIRVTPAKVNRALRFMDTFVKCIYARGHTITNDDTGTYVVIKRIRLKVTFRERTSRVAVTDNPFKSIEWHPNGKLAFRLEGRLRAEWFDGKTRLLEEQLANILAKLELVAGQEEEHALKLKYLQEEREREQLRRVERERRQREERTSLKQLLTNTGRWEKAEKIRQYAVYYGDVDHLVPGQTDQAIC
ncbi:hypothetical protein [Mucilaginibacter terrae]|uniref:Uncharacterized protein n=1 Tax=Mucilaginibacter terrae TaxID=1955052 RepID=A0ABU3GWC1_9SPHI|nr:hypothetical protein [Mucilaginibacter terrae]MDT3403761.1 hypothetical protein [Mucilaginibacter terrae]